MDFASYAFNKSHAAPYAVLAYRTAYLKLYYPVEYMTALVNSFLGNADKIAQYIYSIKQMGIKVLPPDINRSQARFSVEGGAIRFGLAAVRNVGEKAIDELIEERSTSGNFLDFTMSSNVRQASTSGWPRPLSRLAPSIFRSKAFTAGIGIRGNNGFSFKRQKAARNRPNVAV